MNRVRTSGLLAAALSIASAAARAQSPEPPPQPGVAFSRSVLASEVIGMRVRTPSGERIGAVEDLVLSSGNLVSAAVVSVGGFFGLGEKRVEVPYDKLLLEQRCVARGVVDPGRARGDAGLFGVIVRNGAFTRRQSNGRLSRAAAGCACPTLRRAPRRTRKPRGASRRTIRAWRKASPRTRQRSTAMKSPKQSSEVSRSRKRRRRRPRGSVTSVGARGR